MAPTALPLFSCAARTIRIWYVANPIRLEHVPVAIALTTKLQTIDPGAKVVCNLLTHRLVHSLAGNPIISKYWIILKNIMPGSGAASKSMNGGPGVKKPDLIGNMTVHD